MNVSPRRSSLGGWLASLVPGGRANLPVGFAASLVEHLADGVVACDAEGNIVYMNRRARQGGSDAFADNATVPAGLTVDRWAEQFRLYAPGGSELAATEDLPLVRALRGETVRDARLEVRGEGGARLVVNSSAGPVLDEAGRIQGAVVVIQDRTELAARESEIELGRAAAEHMAVGVGMVSATDGRIVYANEQWERLFGYGPGELLGRHISAVNAPATVSPEERAQEIFDALERDGTWAGEIHNVRKDGTQLWTHASISRFDHPEHGPLWITASSDITERKVGDSTLRSMAERFRAVFEDAPVGIALIGTDRYVIDANRLLCEMLGWPRGELTGRQLTTLLHPDDHDRDAELAARVLGGELPLYRMPSRYLTRGGDVLPVMVTSTVLRAPDGRPLYSLVIVDAGTNSQTPDVPLP